MQPTLQALGKFQTPEIKGYYTQYMASNQGHITQHTMDALQKESVHLECSKDEARQAKDDYINKKIGYSSYIKRMKSTKSIESKSKALLLVQTQLDAQKGKAKQYQYLYNTKPDQSLLLQSDDYLFIFFLIILCISTFFTDRDTEMEILIRTTKLGSVHTTKAKLWILFLTVLLSGLMSEGMTMLMIYLDMGSFHFLYPIQSIPEYATSSLHINIITMYLIQMGIKLFGFFSISLFFSFLANKVRKLTSIYGLTIFTIMLPPLLFKSSKLLYFNPLWGFQSPQYYFRDTIVNDGTPLFSKFTSPEILLVLGVAIIICYGFIRILNRKRNTFGRWTRKGILLLFVFLLAGCTSHHVQNTDVRKVYNYRPLTMIEMDHKNIYIENSLKRNYDTYNLSNNKTIRFDRDITYSFQDSEILCVIPYRDAVYYMRVKDSYDFYIVRRDRKSNHETIVYASTVFKDNADSIVPFFSSSHVVPNNGDMPTSFFIDGNDLYIMYSTSVEQIDLSSHKKKEIINDFLIISFFNHDIYYVDNEGCMHDYNMKTSTSKIVFKDLVDQFEVTTDGIYYTNLNDHDTLYFYSIATKKSARVLNKRIHAFSVYNKMLAYMDTDCIVMYDLTSKKGVNTLQQSADFLNC